MQVLDHVPAARPRRRGAARLARNVELGKLYWDVWAITCGRARLAWTNGVLNADEW